ncbi:hypothetical protein NUW54_g13594 [Trametes sanguinea]|uniref:Uncharacterized protein n=1 Tax=Trametes sanguinea TaxID=158606 RepID=A0ACC1MK28_9APHY|nr:hypothetical protein NUW54_g13594 [Trametes sanguinea]
MHGNRPLTPTLASSPVLFHQARRGPTLAIAIPLPPIRLRIYSSPAAVAASASSSMFGSQTWPTLHRRFHHTHIMTTAPTAHPLTQHHRLHANGRTPPSTSRAQISASGRDDTRALILR